MTPSTQPATIARTAALIRSGAVSPADLVQSCLGRIEAGTDLNAFITVLRERALSDAARAAEALSAGRDAGPLHGIPVAVKDLIAVAGIPTTCGSRVPPRTPDVDAPLVRGLRAAGAIVIGKTNLHEFAFGTTSDESVFGPVRHPRDRSRAAGGSSGGSAVAVAEGMCFGAVGTDTGGSIRIPAAACGIVGLKPTLGEVSCSGVFPLSATLDHAGPMARSVADAALLFHAMAGRRPQEPAAASGQLRFGVPRPYFFDRLDRAVREATERAIERLRSAGHHVADCAVAHAGATADVYLHICLPEASCLHAQTLVDRPGDYLPGIRLRLEMGRYLLAEDYVRAMEIRQALAVAVDRALQGFDALLLPALAIPAPPVGASSADVDGATMPVRAAMLRLTQLFNITGHPAIALPAGDGPDGLPRGIQLVGRRRATTRLLDVAAAVEGLIGGERSTAPGTGS